MSQKNYQELQKTFESPAFRGFCSLCSWSDGIVDGSRSKTDGSRVTPRGHRWTWRDSDWAALRTNLFYIFFCIHGELPFLSNLQKLTFSPFFNLITCPLLCLKPLPLSHHFTQPRRSTCGYSPCLKTSLTFRLSLKMTLPSTIACGNIIRPTLNFNWYAVPGSSWGNYHSVHNKSHNMHLENDCIIHCASIKVFCDPSETRARTHTHTHTRTLLQYNCDEVKTVLCIWLNAYLMVQVAAGMIDSCVGLVCSASALDGGAPRPCFSWSHYPNMFLFFPNQRMVY